jgi:hypothetical protein
MLLIITKIKINTFPIMILRKILLVMIILKIFQMII